MAKGKELSVDLRTRIVDAHKNGKGYKAISRQFLVPVSTVQSMVKKYRDLLRKTLRTRKELDIFGKGRQKSNAKGQYQPKNYFISHIKESQYLKHRNIHVNVTEDIEYGKPHRLQTKEGTSSSG